MKKLLITVIAIATAFYSANAQGKLYGLTSTGGIDGVGTIFHYQKGTNIFTTDHSFRVDGNTVGLRPDGELTDGGNGKYYGVTSEGGIYNAGVLFEWDPAANTCIRKHDFGAGTDGRQPFGGVTLLNGKLYGVTAGGGTGATFNNAGMMFEYDPDVNNTSPYREVYSFFNLSYTSAATGKPAIIGDKLYMMLQITVYGRSMVFEIDPMPGIPNPLREVASLDANTYGYATAGNSLFSLNGLLYGMTSSGGTNDGGTIFSCDPDISNPTPLIKLHDFDDFNGKNSRLSLMHYNNKLYGMTEAGGSNNDGVLFSFDLDQNNPTPFAKLKDFDQSTTGNNPVGTLYESRGILFGSTYYGGTRYSGTIFQYDTDPTNIDPFQVKMDFSGSPNTTGTRIVGTLTLIDGKFCALTYFGGRGSGGSYGGISSGVGAIIEWDTTTTTCSTKIDFSYAKEGGSPFGSLLQVRGKLYGTTAGGGVSSNGDYASAGALFELDTLTGVYTKKADFGLDNTGSYLSKPIGTLARYNNKLYGSTSTNIYEYDPATSTITNKVNFSNSIGAYTTGGNGIFSLYNGKFYLLTDNGGTNTQGTLFEWDPTTNAIVKKIDFENSATGSLPRGGLVLFNGKFYGTTIYGGNYGSGVLFEWDPQTNTIVKKIESFGSNGDQFPMGTLVVLGNKLYGMTGSSLYEWDPSSNTITNKATFNTTNFASVIVSEGKLYCTTSSKIFEYDPITSTSADLVIFNGANGSDQVGSLVALTNGSNLMNIKGNNNLIENGAIVTSTLNNTDFGDIESGEPGLKTYTISNTGTTPLNISNITVSSPGFFVNNLSASIIPIGETATFDVSVIYFFPAGEVPAVVTVSTDNNLIPEYTFSIKATIICPIIQAEIAVAGNGIDIPNGAGNLPAVANNTDFGEVPINATVYKTFNITNTGTRNLDINIVYAFDYPTNNTSRFSVTTGPIGTVAPGASATFTVKFSPTITGSIDAIVRILSNDCDEGQFQFKVSGRGVNTCTTPTSPTISGLSSICTTNNTSFTASANNTSVATTYSWTGPSGFTASTASTGNISVAGDYTCTISNGTGCAVTVTQTLTLSARRPSTPGAITQSPNATDICTSMATGVTYTITAVTGASNYKWAVPLGSGCTISSASNPTPVTDTLITSDPSVIITFPSTYSTGSIKVAASNGCGQSTFRSFTAKRIAPATPGIISTSKEVLEAICSSSTVTYGIAPVANADGYLWTVPTGATITSANVNGSSIDVSFVPGFNTGSISVKAFRICADSVKSAARSLTVKKLLPTTPLAIATASTNVCTNIINGTEAIFTVTPTAAGNLPTGYQWTVTGAGATITSVNGTAITPTTTITTSVTELSIGVTYSGTYIAGTVAVRSVRLCQTSTSARSITIRKTAIAPTLSGSPSVCTGTNVTYTVTPPTTGITSYIWSKPSNATVVTGALTGSAATSITLRFNTLATGNVSVKAVSVCGTSAASNIIVVMPTACPNVNRQTPIMETLNNISATKAALYPNPNAGVFRLRIETPNKVDPAKVQVINSLGQIVRELQGTNTNGIIDLRVTDEKLSEGVYYLKYFVGAETGSIKMIIKK